MVVIRPLEEGEEKKEEEKKKEEKRKRVNSNEVGLILICILQFYDQCYMVITKFEITQFYS